MSSSKVSYAEYLALVDALESPPSTTAHFFFSHEGDEGFHATVTKKGALYDYVQHQEYPDLASWAAATLAHLPATAGNPLANLRFGTSGYSLSYTQIAVLLELREEDLALPVGGGAGAGAGAGTSASSSTSTGPMTRAKSNGFKPAFTKAGFEVLRKIERGETLTAEEEDCEIFEREDDASASADDSDYTPSEDEEDEDGTEEDEEVLTERIARNRAIADGARKEADRLMKHLMSLAAQQGTPAGVLAGIRKAYEEQKARETAAAIAFTGDYLDKRGFFGYAPNVGRVLDKELGEYAYIARQLLVTE